MNVVAVTRVDKRHRVTIPSCVRRALALQTGDTVVFFVRGHCAIVRRRDDADTQFVRGLGATLSEWSSAADEHPYADLR